MPRHNTKKYTGTKWTVNEDKYLQDEINDDLSIREIGLLHKRSQGSILHRIYKLKISKQPKIISTYSFNDDTEFIPTISSTTSNSSIKNQICVFDTETTGLPPYVSITKSDQWPRMIQFACSMFTVENGVFTKVKSWSTYIKPDGFTIPEEVTKIHHITNEIAATGITFEEWCSEFENMLPTIHTFVAHNMMFDNNIIQSELYRAKKCNLLQQFKRVSKECTMMMGKKYIMDQKMESRLSLVHLCTIFSIPIPSEDKLHDAFVDTELCSLLYIELMKKGVVNKRTDLTTLFTDKEVIKHLGAKWDCAQKTWYIYDSDVFSFYVKKWFYNF
jgi:DNA polymerase-3 subunit epsilon